MQSKAKIDPNRIGIIGWSRGGEAALLVGATYPQIKAVVSFSAYTVALRGTCASAADRVDSSWSYLGQPVPFLVDDGPAYRAVHPLEAAVSAGEDPIPLIPKFVC